MMFSYSVLILYILYFSKYPNIFEYIDNYYGSKISFTSLFYKEKNYLLTGASDNHFKLLEFFLYRVALHAEQMNIVVWMLDLNSTLKERLTTTVEEISKIKLQFNIFLEDFPFNTHPPFFNISEESGQYAWKPACIYLSQKKYKGNVLWLDAGCKIVSNLKNLFSLVKKEGFWSMRSSGNIMEYTYPTMIKRFNITDKEATYPNCSGGLVGFAIRNKLAVQLLENWYKCACELECIAPKGSNRNNHRQDQAILSVLVAKSNHKFKCGWPRSKADFIKHYDGHLTTEEFRLLRMKVIRLNMVI